MADQSKRVYLFNCDNTYKLEIVEEFLVKVEEKCGFQIVVERLYFGLQRMAEMCETTIPTLQMDFAIFVVHANESRLSINEDNAGIGYAKLYRLLLQKTGNKVLIVIGGDSYYKDPDEEARCVISRWAKRKVASQFHEEYLDGRQSFIFSWDKKHRPIHEEALRHYFDPSKRGFKFEYTPPKPQPKPPKVPKVTPPAITPREEVFVEVTDDRKPLLQEEGGTTGTRRRSISSDRERQKRESRNDAEEGSYGAIGSGASGTSAVYPSDTVLLETRMRHGRISYKAEDAVQWKDRWQPSEKTKSDLMEDWKSTPVAKVQFISSGNGGVRIVVVKATPGGVLRRCWEFCLNGCERCMVVCGNACGTCMVACGNVCWRGTVACGNACGRCMVACGNACWRGMVACGNACWTCMVACGNACWRGMVACGNACWRGMVACFLGLVHYLGLLWGWFVGLCRR